MTNRNAVLSALRSADRPLTAQNLACIIYADDPDGGPDWAISCIRVFIHELRQEGHKISTILNSGYILQEIPHGSPSKTNLPADDRAY